MDYRLDNNYYSFKSIAEKIYINYYLSKNDSTEYEKFENIKPQLNYYYRIFNDKNNLIEEKHLTTTKNPFPYKPESLIHLTRYQYNKDNKIIHVANVTSYINSLAKNYATERTEQHTYLNEGLTHTIKHFFNKKLQREELIKFNPEGIMVKYTNHWLNPNRTIQYTYNSKGHWITCVHYDKNIKARYLIERNIKYYSLK